jgi:hypothetical protein
MPENVINRIGLTISQTFLLVIIGAALWFLAAVVLHGLAPLGALEGSARAITYALCIPAIWPFVWLVRITVKLRHDKIFTAIAVATATALLIDGIVVAYYPVIYGNTAQQVANCAAAILWGAGVGLVLAFIMNRENLK